MIAKFLEWLCQGTRRIVYAGVAGIPWPNGWDQPDPIWCAAVFGAHGGGFAFPLGPTDNDPSNFIENSATKLGSDNSRENLQLLALYYGKTNGHKLHWTSADIIQNTRSSDSDGSAVSVVSQVRTATNERTV